MLNLVTFGIILAHAGIAYSEPQLYEVNDRKFLQQSFTMPKHLSEGLNTRPIIGVLTQPLSEDQKSDHRYKGKTSYIMSSYIDYLKSAGARTVPLIYDGNLDDELAKIDHLNGVFYCGGSGAGAYDVFGKKVFEKVKKMNDEGNYLPIWGTCLGFEDLAMYASDNSDKTLSPFNADDESYSISYLVPPKDTKMYSILGDDAHVFEKYNITYNHHSYGVSPDAFNLDQGLASIFTPTSISYDDDGKPFVASMESKQYPFYATQFHPEKAQFIFYPKTKIDHSTISIFYNRYFGDMFVNQCKQNNNHFKSYEVEESFRTENFGTVVTKAYDGVDFVF
ncbi:peptidase c26 family protein [Stylonychia lemnae]|uniref:folate gamma-glutamyl hydrolase n=1 Tax=Stylonychia lemnae TaxID=5949 RepID=A0A078A8U4_STYLE|nr:peptidase c26 family protein [Stylonychia lemnae]|eukprot:CDW78649.1 peptidase c26 family protein [Stylonychia lemnae]